MSQLTVHFLDWKWLILWQVNVGRAVLPLNFLYCLLLRRQRHCCKSVQRSASVSLWQTYFTSLKETVTKVTIQKTIHLYIYRERKRGVCTVHALKFLEFFVYVWFKFFFLLSTLFYKIFYWQICYQLVQAAHKECNSFHIKATL